MLWAHLEDILGLWEELQCNETGLTQKGLVNLGMAISKRDPCISPNQIARPPPPPHRRVPADQPQSFIVADNDRYHS